MRTSSTAVVLALVLLSSPTVLSEDNKLVSKSVASPLGVEIEEVALKRVRTKMHHGDNDGDAEDDQVDDDDFGDDDFDTSSNLTLAEKFRNRIRKKSPDNVCLEPTYPSDPYRTCYQRAADPSNYLKKDEIQRDRYNAAARKYKKSKDYYLEPYMPPYLKRDEELITATFHLELKQDDTQLSCDEKVVMEEIVLEYLNANVGNEDTFFPVCASVKEWKGFDQVIPDDSGDTAVTTACQMDVTYVIKKRYKDKIDMRSNRHLEVDEIRESTSKLRKTQHRELRKRCSSFWRPACCSGNAINGNPNSKTCRQNGCSPKKCPHKRPPKNDNANTNTLNKRFLESSSDEGERKLETYIESPGNLYNKDFNQVLNKYTDFQPERTRAVMGATNTLFVAGCSVNRYMEEVYDIPFSCSIYEADDCATNEDILFKRGEDVCVPDPTYMPTYFPTGTFE